MKKVYSAGSTPFFCEMGVVTLVSNTKKYSIIVLIRKLNSYNICNINSYNNNL